MVLIDGKPTAEPILKTLPAVLAAFQGGQAQGQAIAEIIMGITVPSGKLPISFPVSADVLPVYYNYKPSARRSGWCDVSDGVLWPFGFGLSYTQFNYSSLVVQTEAVPKDGIATIAVDVTNIGLVAAVEVVQLYIRDAISSVTTPVKMLKGFQRVFLDPSETKTVTFNVDVAFELRVLNRTYHWQVEEGLFYVMIGGSSDNTPVNGQFNIV